MGATARQRPLRLFQFCNTLACVTTTLHNLAVIVKVRCETCKQVSKVGLSIDTAKDMGVERGDWVLINECLLCAGFVALHPGGLRVAHCQPVR